MYVTDLIGNGNTGPIKNTEFSRYASSKEGDAIINAMASIPSAAVRRHVINLAETIGFVRAIKSPQTASGHWRFILPDLGWRGFRL